MESGGEKGNELWSDFPTKPNSRLQFQGAGAHPWLLERRNASARIKIWRLAADDRVSSRTLVSEVQFRLNPMLSHGGFSDYQLVFRPSSAGLYVWHDKDSHL